MLDLMVNGRIALVLWEFFPNEELSAPEVWERRLPQERAQGGPPFLSFSCGATYAAVRACVEHDLLVEAALTRDGVRKYVLTRRGRSLAREWAEKEGPAGDRAGIASSPATSQLHAAGF